MDVEDVSEHSICDYLILGVGLKNGEADFRLYVFSSFCNNKSQIKVKLMITF